MKKKLYTLIIFLTIPLFSIVQAQDCFYYHEFECKYPNSAGFDYSGQSRGALFAYGMTSQFKIVTFTGDYNISICHQFKLKNVRLRLIEDNESMTVIYDNSEFKYQTEVSFSNNVARKIIIEVSVPEAPNAKEKKEMHCLGVLIHYKNQEQQQINKVGF